MYTSLTKTDLESFPAQEVIIMKKWLQRILAGLTLEGKN